MKTNIVFIKENKQRNTNWKLDKGIKFQTQATYTMNLQTKTMSIYFHGFPSKKHPHANQPKP